MVDGKSRLPEILDKFDYYRNPENWCRATFHINPETGHSSDIRNNFSALFECISTQSGIENLKPLPTYEEYIAELDAKWRIKGLKETLVAMVKPEFLQKFDQLVLEFNTELPAIIAKKDYEKLKEYYNALELLVTK